VAGDPVAWNVIEPGWSVLDAAGNEMSWSQRLGNKPLGRRP
jgi:hypothetical protein